MHILEIHLKVLFIYEERSVLGVNIVVKLFPEFGSPKRARKGPGSLPLLPTPGVPHLKQGYLSILGFHSCVNVEQTVGVVLEDTHFSLFFFAHL